MNPLMGASVVSLEGSRFKRRDQRVAMNAPITYEREYWGLVEIPARRRLNDRLVIDKIQRPDKGLEIGSGDGAPSYIFSRSRLRPATFLAVSRVIDKIDVE
jgi:hypothetical protein